MKCTNCGNECDDSKEKCPECGTVLNDFTFEVVDDSDNDAEEQNENSDDDISISYAKHIEYDFDDTDEIDAETINACAAEIEELEKKGMFEPGEMEKQKYIERYVSQKNMDSNNNSSSFEDNPKDDEYHIQDDNEGLIVESREYNFTESNESYMEEESNLRREMEKPPKLSKSKKTAIIAAIALVIFSIASAFFVYKKALIDKFEVALHNNEYEEAADIYTSLMDQNKESADKIVIDKIDDIFSRYKDGSINSSEAIDELKLLDNIGSGVSESISKAVDDFKNIVISEGYFSNAEEFYNNKEYENAIVNYYSVTEADYHYDQAQKQLKKVIEEFKEIQITDTEKYIQNNEYDKAINGIKYCLELLKDDKELTKKLSEYQDAKYEIYKEDIFVNEESCLKEDDFAGAVKIISDAINEYGEKDDLKTKLEACKTKVYENADSYIKDKRYNKLMKMLEAYVKVVPDDEKVLSMVEEYKPYVSDGYNLSELKMDVSGKIYVNDEDEDYKDASGTFAESVIELCGYKNLDNSGSLSINNNKYNKLKGTLGYSSYEYYKSGKAKLIIKADDEVIFESEKLSSSMKDVELDIDIPECKNITFEWSRADKKSVDAYGIALCDFKLVNDNNKQSAE